MSELKPCPFCGGSVRICKRDDENYQYWFITQSNKANRCTCRLFMESMEFPFGFDGVAKLERQALIRDWNRRADDGEN